MCVANALLGTVCTTTDVLVSVGRVACFFSILPVSVSGKEWVAGVDSVRVGSRESALDFIIVVLFFRGPLPN